MVFVDIQDLQDLEKEHKWEQAISLLQNKWYQNKSDIEFLLRLATESWYVMSNWDFLDLDNSDLEFDKIQSILIDTYNYFSENYLSSNKGLAIFGYMMSLYPNYFYLDIDSTGQLFLQYENYGKDMLKLAYTNEPENSLYKALYLGATNNSSERIKDARQQLNETIADLFPNNTEVEDYFKDVLCK